MPACHAVALHLDLAVERVELAYDLAILRAGRPCLRHEDEQRKQSNPSSEAPVPHGLPQKAKRDNCFSDPTPKSLYAPTHFNVARIAPAHHQQ